MPRPALRSVTPALVCLGLVAGIATTTSGALPSFAADTAPAAQRDSAAAQTVSAPLSVITADGQTALVKAQAAIAGASKVSMDITASGLDVGTTDIVVDTSDLSDLVDKLEALDVTPTLMIPALTADAVAETAAAYRDLSYDSYRRLALAAGAPPVSSRGVVRAARSVTRSSRGALRAS